MNTEPKELTEGQKRARRLLYHYSMLNTAMLDIIHEERLRKEFIISQVGKKDKVKTPLLDAVSKMHTSLHAHMMQIKKLYPKVDLNTELQRDEIHDIFIMLDDIYDGKINERTKTESNE